jgi:hypothetical protein
MANTPPELQQLLSESVNRTRYQNPLFQAVSQMAYRGLPTYAREGTSLGSMGPAAPIVPMNNDKDTVPDWLKVLGAGLGGAALNGLGPNGNMLKAAIDGLKKIFGRNQSRTVQGNKPYSGGILPPGNSYNPFDLFTGWDNGQNNVDPLTGRVTTNESFSFPNDVFNDPYFLNAMWNGMPNDPSRGTGVGPGMWDFYNSGGGGDTYNDYRFDE